MDYFARSNIDEYSVAKYAKEELKFEKVYAWNDMFSHTDSALLKEYELGKLLIPVIWGYAPDVTLEGYFPQGMHQRYAEVGECVYG